jgi:hypothetical protein
MSGRFKIVPFIDAGVRVLVNPRPNTTPERKSTYIYNGRCWRLSKISMLYSKVLGCSRWKAKD